MHLLNRSKWKCFSHQVGCSRA